ncbi:MAG: XRE family transcriptional regulator [Clostridia bacterium]|nr:XRE family transcriptional regulator [Clostridia bacterium]
MHSTDTFGARLRQARRDAQLTQKELAQRIGALHNSVSQWETNVTRPSPDMVRALCEALHVTADHLLGLDEGSVGLPAPNLIRVHTRKVPVLGDIAAGEPIVAEREYGEYADVDDACRCDLALHVAGDSMEPLIHRGDLVFLQLADDVDDGQIAAVLIDDTATLKRVYHTRNGLQLVSENHKYAPMLILPEDGCPVRILGRAVSFRRAL